MVLHKNMFVTLYVIICFHVTAIETLQDPAIGAYMFLFQQFHQAYWIQRQLFVGSSIH